MHLNHMCRSLISLTGLTILPKQTMPSFLYKYNILLYQDKGVAVPEYLKKV